MTLRRGQADRMNRLSDLVVGDPAPFPRQQWSGTHRGIIQSKVRWRRQFVLIGEALGTARGAMKQQAAFVFGPGTRDGALIDFLPRKPRIILRTLEARSGAETPDRTGGAAGIVAPADERTEFHHRLVVGARVG